MFNVYSRSNQSCLRRSLYRKGQRTTAICGIPITKGALFITAFNNLTSRLLPVRDRQWERDPIRCRVVWADYQIGDPSRFHTILADHQREAPNHYHIAPARWCMDKCPLIPATLVASGLRLTVLSPKVTADLGRTRYYNLQHWIKRLLVRSARHEHPILLRHISDPEDWPEKCDLISRWVGCGYSFPCCFADVSASGLVIGNSFSLFVGL